MRLGTVHEALDRSPRWVIFDQVIEPSLRTDVRFALKVTYLLRGTEMTRRAKSGHAWEPQSSPIGFVNALAVERQVRDADSPS
jgi:hypothetical protein